MVQLDIPAAFAVSMLFVDLGRNVLKREAENSPGEKPKAYYQFLFRSIFFAAFVICPAGLYLLAGWPGWEQLYWGKRVEELILQGWFNALLPTFFIMSIVLAGYIGHILGYRLITTGKEKYLRPIYLGVLVLSAIPVLLSYPAFLLVGTYDQYHNLNGQMREAMVYVWKNPYDFSIGWLGVMIYFTAALVYSILKIRRKAKEDYGN